MFVLAISSLVIEVRKYIFFAVSSLSQLQAGQLNVDGVVVVGVIR